MKANNPKNLRRVRALERLEKAIAELPDGGHSTFLGVKYTTADRWRMDNEANKLVSRIVR